LVILGSHKAPRTLGLAPIEAFGPEFVGRSAISGFGMTGANPNTSRGGYRPARTGATRLVPRPAEVHCRYMRYEVAAR
jgi:hypothetical protein